MSGAALRWLAAASLLVLLAGCAGSGDQPVRRAEAPPTGAAAGALPSASTGLEGTGPGSTSAGSTSVGSTSAGEVAELSAAKKAAGIAGCPASDADVPAVRSGLPDVVLECLGGGRQVRLAGLRGRPMLISVWAQWCGPCRAEAPLLSEVARTSSGQLLVLGVDLADPQPGLAIEFARQAGWRFPQLADPDQRMAAALQVVGPPQTFFVRADGVIAYRQVGAFHSAAQIRSLAEQHLGVRL